MNAKLLGGVAGAALFALIVTKPSRQDFEKQVTDILRATIGNSTLTNKREVFSTIKSALSVTSTDYLVTARYEASGGGSDIACWALLTKFACSGGVALVSSEDGQPSASP